MASSSPIPPKLCLIKTLWGIDDPISVDLFQSIKNDEGYSGVEIIRLAWKDVLQELNVDDVTKVGDGDGGTDGSTTTGSGSVLIDSLNTSNLMVVCQIHTAGGYIEQQNNHDGEYMYCGAYDVDTHVTSFQQQLEECTQFLSHVDAGGFVNVHAGVDAWTIDESMDFLTQVLRLIHNAQLPFQVTFETHRQRLFGSPFQTRDILNHPTAGPVLSQLRLNADLSHWYCACERVFDVDAARDGPWWSQLLERIAIHTTYIHARLGFAQGPQIADPSASEHTVDCQLQLTTWKRLLRSMKNRRPGGNGGGQQQPCIYMSPEYGPPPYMPVMPHTQTPVASLPDAVEYTKNLIIDLFNDEGR